MHEEMEPGSVVIVKAVVVMEIFVVLVILMDKLGACCKGWERALTYRVIWTLVYFTGFIPWGYEIIKYKDSDVLYMSVFFLWSFVFLIVQSYFPDPTQIPTKGEVRTRTSKSTIASGENIFGTNGTMEKLGYVSIDFHHD